MLKTILQIPAFLAVFLFTFVIAESVRNPRKYGRLGANESSAISVLRTIAIAQETFRSAMVLDADDDGLGEYGTLEELAGLDSRLPVDPPFIDEQLGGGNKSGYIFKVYIGENACQGQTGIDPDETDYYATAIPLAYGRSGYRSFCIDASGVIRGSDAAGQEPTCAAITSTASPWPVIGG